ncbi:Trm112 family protein [Myxococcus stipitatus]|uniref:Trm112 family protein n=1 Tax=Myxococcus stipitatus TaxID=83455 RepID=UPI0030CC215C
MPVVDSGLLAVLGCPRCKGPLEEHVAPEREALRCERCRYDWPVEDGVPQLLPELGRRWDAPNE